MFFWFFAVEPSPVTLVHAGMTKGRACMPTQKNYIKIGNNYFFILKYLLKALICKEVVFMNRMQPMSYISRFFYTLFSIGLMLSPLHAAMRQAIDDHDTQALVAFMRAHPAEKETFMEHKRYGVLEKHPRLKNRINHMDFTGSADDIKLKNYAAFVALAREDLGDEDALLPTRVHAGLGLARLFAQKGVYPDTPLYDPMLPTIENFRDEVMGYLRDIYGLEGIRPSYRYHAILWEAVIEADGYQKGVGGAANNLGDLDRAWTLLGTAEALKDQHHLSKNVYLWKSLLLAEFGLRPLAVPMGQDVETYHKQHAEDLYDLYKNRVPRPAVVPPLFAAGHAVAGGNFAATTHRVEYQTDRGARGNVDEIEHRLDVALAAWQVPGVVPGGFAPGGGFPPAPGGGHLPEQDESSDDDAHGPDAGGHGAAALKMMNEDALQGTDANDGRDSSTTDDLPEEGMGSPQPMEHDQEQGLETQAVSSPASPMGDFSAQEDESPAPAPMVEQEDSPSDEEEQPAAHKRSAIEAEDDDEVLHRRAPKNRRIESSDEESEGEESDDRRIAQASLKKSKRPNQVMDPMREYLGRYKEKHPSAKLTLPQAMDELVAHSEETGVTQEQSKIVTVRMAIRDQLKKLNIFLYATDADPIKRVLKQYKEDHEGQTLDVEAAIHLLIENSEETDVTPAALSDNSFKTRVRRILRDVLKIFQPSTQQQLSKEMMTILQEGLTANPSLSYKDAQSLLEEAQLLSPQKKKERRFVAALSNWVIKNRPASAAEEVAVKRESLPTSIIKYFGDWKATSSGKTLKMDEALRTLGQLNLVSDPALLVDKKFKLRLKGLLKRLEIYQPEWQVDKTQARLKSEKA